MNPLDKVEVLAKKDEDGKPNKLQTNFYLIAVPSYFKDTNGYTY